MKTPYQPWQLVVPINQDIGPFGTNGLDFTFVNDYSWIYYTACVIAFYAACGIGANDVANSFATSVGSGSLTIMQAVLIAGIFEFAGAALLGASVTDTIKGKLIKPSAFEEDPDILMIGMFVALVGTSFWLTLATVKEFPVSTTHSIVGAILGWALCVPQVAIAWKEIGKIVMSWFVTPAISGVASALFFFLIRTFILRSENSFERTLKFFPVLIFVVVTINVWFVIAKGGKGLGWLDKIGGYGPAFGVAAGVGAGCGILIFFLLVPRMRKQLENVTDKDRDSTGDSDVEIEMETEQEANAEAIEDDVTKAQAETGNQPNAKVTDPNAKPSSSANGLSGWIQNRNKNIHEIRNDRVAEIHDAAEKFEYRTELAFGYLQVFTACMMSFAHGANDVANSIGPLSAIVAIYDTNGDVSKKSPVQRWILILGGAGIVVGLAVYGHKVIRALGVKLIKITPSRGSCIELATAFVIVIGSIASLPLSTTQTMVGASIGLGILEGAKQSINFKLFGKIFFGWVITLIVAGLVSAALFSLIVYSPSMNRPISPQNCMGTYGQYYPNATTLTLVAKDTVLVGNMGTGEFSVIEE